MRPGLRIVLGSGEAGALRRWGVWTKSVKQVRGVFREPILILKYLKAGWGHRGQFVYVEGGVLPASRTSPPFLKSVTGFFLCPKHLLGSESPPGNGSSLGLLVGPVSQTPGHLHGQEIPHSDERLCLTSSSCRVIKKYGRFHFEKRWVLRLARSRQGLVGLVGPACALPSV